MMVWDNYENYTPILMKFFCQASCFGGMDNEKRQHTISFLGETEQIL